MPLLHIKGTFLRQFIKFVRFVGNCSYGAFQSRQIWIRPQNWGHIIFCGSGSIFAWNYKLRHNLRPVSHKGLAISLSCFSSNFTLGFEQILATSKFGKMLLLNAFFRSIYWICLIWRKQRLCVFRGRRIQIRPQNWGSTIFGGLGPYFCTKFGHNSRTAGCTGSATFPSCFSLNFTKVLGTFAKTHKFAKMPLRHFLVKLLHSFAMVKTAVMMIFKVAEFVSVPKIEMPLFLEGLGTIFARNLTITGECWIIQASNVSIIFLFKFYIRKQPICRNFGNVRICRSALIT